MVTPGQWSFVALVIDPDKATIYLGSPGQPLTSRSQVHANQVAAFDGVTYVGQDPQGDRFYNGVVDDVAIFRKALTPDEVAGRFETRMGLVRLSISKETGQIVLKWPRERSSGDRLGETFSPVSGALSPLPVTPDKATKFYRVTVP